LSRWSEAIERNEACGFFSVACKILTISMGKEIDSGAWRLSQTRLRSKRRFHGCDLARNGAGFVLAASLLSIEWLARSARKKSGPVVIAGAGQGKPTRV
jgi:hypothetical protein